MMWYRTALQLPPNSSNLLVWMDATELSVADGISVSSMPNKGILGGSWNNTIGGNILPPIAATVDGKRALSFPTTWSLYPPNQSPTAIQPWYAYNNSTFTVPTISCANGGGLTTLVILRNTYDVNVNSGAPACTHFVLNGAGYSYFNTQFNGAYQFVGARYYWTFNEIKTNGNQSVTVIEYADNNENDVVDTPLLRTPNGFGEFIAVCYKLSTSLSRNKVVKIFRKNAASWNGYKDNAIFPNDPLLGLPGGGKVSIGIFGDGTKGGISGWITETMAWNSLVSDIDIKTYLNNKYGGSW